MVDDAVIVRGLSIGGGSNAPTILRRTDQEFIPAILNELSLTDELRANAGLQKVAASIARDRDTAGVLRLYQPVHQTFNVALIELACATLGQPRLDPEKIDSAGLVVRRVAEGIVERRQDLRSLNAVEAWTMTGKRVRGWSRLNPSRREEDLDPDPARRALELNSGNDEINRRLARWKQGLPALTESFTPLFVAPPEICRNTRRTILYGVLPVTSSEVSEPPPPGKPGEASAGLPRFDETDVAKLRTHLPFYLQERKTSAVPIVPRAGQSVTWANAAADDLQTFILSLRQLKLEFAAFDTQGKGRGLKQELNGIAIDVTGRKLGDFLEEATEILVDLDGRESSSPRGLLMPEKWPEITRAQEDRILDQVMRVLTDHLDSLMKSEGRFELETGRYRVRAFVRVKRSDGCPPVIYWSDYSEPFRIVPWYEGSGMPPVKISLPDPFDKGFLEGLKPNGIFRPNVAFKVPERLFNLLNKNSPDDFLKGKATEGDFQLGLDWICGFNIPIITICAFIVLFIFLLLLNIIFWWLPFIKICIPFPKGQASTPVPTP